VPMTVDELIAREEIRQCLLRHFRAADRADLDLERAAWWPDGTFVGGPVEGTASDFAAPLFEALPAQFETLMHYIANMLIQVSGDTAHAEIYGIGWHLLADDPEMLKAVLGEAKLAEFGNDVTKRYEMWVGVRYAVELRRREGEWRIFTMQPIIEWTRVQRYSGISEGGLPSAMPTRARRDRGDASYFGGAFIG
jgi:SnoaL-like domain